LAKAHVSVTERILSDAFFDRNAQSLARALIGKILRHRVDGLWLAARIVETEAYYLDEKGSHASLGYTHKRRALFMPAGTIYMYYARGGDSLNFSAAGPGNAVLIKAAAPWQDAISGPDALARMQALNPAADGTTRPVARLCAGQTLLCRALDLKVPDWDARRCDPQSFYVADAGERPETLIRTARLGIPPGRDEHLPYRYVDPDFVKSATQNPLRRGQCERVDYWRVDGAGRVVARVCRSGQQPAFTAGRGTPD